eukprot:gene4923-8511_t
MKTIRRINTKLVYLSKNSISTNIIQQKKQLKTIFNTIYPKNSSQNEFEEFFEELKKTRKKVDNNPHLIQNKNGWWKNSICYCLYVDLFAENFIGLRKKLDYLQELGITLIWMLPIMDSPLRDFGFDVKNYSKIRPDLIGISENNENFQIEQWRIFKDFVSYAHSKGIKILVDTPFNHTSNEHHWFLESKKSKDNKFRDYYIWSNSNELYKECSIIFEGICKSNWKKEGDQFYFHRFFEQQPDLNYSNPKVLLEISKIISNWCEKGIDGFRLDAIPFLWKEDGTDCFGLPNTHQIIKFFRTVVDIVRPGTMLLAESCIEPKKLLKFFGEDDQVHAGNKNIIKLNSAYHFPLIPQIYLSLKRQNFEPISKILDHHITPNLSDHNQWFIFLRCHDEFTFELNPKVEKEEIYNFYCQSENWGFRNRNGVSARLSNLLNHDPKKISLANSILLSIIGTPIIYYGDEFMKENDEEFYNEMIQISGIEDSRYLCRGRIDWNKVDQKLLDNNSKEYFVFNDLKKKIKLRSMYSCLHNGTTEILEYKNRKNEIEHRLLSYKRKNHENQIIFFHNLSSETLEIKIDLQSQCLLGNTIHHKDGVLFMKPYSHHWLIPNNSVPTEN